MLHVFLVAGVGLSIRPLEEADDARVAVVVEERAGRGEEDHRQRQEETHQPDANGDADRHHLAHSLSQRVHYRHVPSESKIQNSNQHRIELNKLLNITQRNYITYKSSINIFCYSYSGFPCSTNWMQY